MVRYTLKILQHLVQDFQSMSDHFETLRIKGLNPTISTTQAKSLRFKRFRTRASLYFKTVFWRFTTEYWKTLESTRSHVLRYKYAQVQKQPLEVFYKTKLFLKISQYSQEKTCAGIP